MSNLNIDQRSIADYFNAKNSSFLIPDYQRPYAWEREECQTLWEDILMFAFPDNDPDNFDPNEEYFLGPIVTFTNEKGDKEIIDGQQRLTTLMLLLRAIYHQVEHQNFNKAVKLKEEIGKSIWKTDEFDEPDKETLKLRLEVTSEEKNEEFRQIMRTGQVQEGQNSLYAQNYRFFQEQIERFLNDYTDSFRYLPIRLLRNCILLPIEADSQDMALRIFSTLNDRGKPLADSDIFKAKMYAHYSNQNRKDEFINKWKDLEEKANNIFDTSSNITPMDDLFTRYMYFERAKQGVRTSTTEALRKFYEKDNYQLLKKEETLENLIDLANFWEDVYNLNPDRFSDGVLKRLFVLNNAPNSMWTYLLSVFFLVNREENEDLNEEKLLAFLDKIIGFIWAFSLIRPGISNLRPPVFAELINMVEGKDVTFEKYLFNVEEIDSILNSYAFTNQKQLTKSMLAWWLFQNPKQELLPLGTPFQVEHIYSVNREKNEQGLIDKRKLEVLGNKSFLERGINIRASDYRFEDKKDYYLGKRGRKQEATNVKELFDLAQEKDDFTEVDIDERNTRIKSAFINYLNSNHLLKR